MVHDKEKTPGRVFQSESASRRGHSPQPVDRLTAQPASLLLKASDTLL